jgi:hypothetical protein
VATEALDEQAGVAHRDASRRANERRAATKNPPTDGQGLVEFACECITSECDRSVKVPLYVYQRIVDSGDQFLVQAAHHAFARHRTIVTLGLMRIEERA